MERLEIRGLSAERGTVVNELYGEFTRGKIKLHRRCLRGSYAIDSGRNCIRWRAFYGTGCPLLRRSATPLDRGPVSIRFFACLRGQRAGALVNQVVVLVWIGAASLRTVHE